MAGVVVVGAGIAGLRGAESLRRRGYEGELTIVGDEPHRPYNRPPLSKELLRGDVSEESCLFDTSRLEATWLLGRAATGLNVRLRMVTLDDGRQLTYDRLLIATGCRPRPWPTSVDLKGIHLLRTLDDARALRETALRSRRAVIIGAGFIGCEVAATLRELGLDVTLIDVADQPMTPLGPELGRRAQRWHQDAGVELLLGAGVDRFLGDGHVTGVCLGDGRVIDADLVVIGIGAVLNTEWLSDSGLELVHGSVRCDQRCLAVGAPEIGVAGDVAAWPDPVTGAPMRLEHWTNAVETAMTAAANLYPDGTGEVLHRPVPTFWSDQYHYKVRAAGAVATADATTVVADKPDEGRLVVEFRRDGELAGAVTVNDHRKHLGYRRQFAEVTVARDPLPRTARPSRATQQRTETA